jgi:hypothetical protein
MCAGFTISTQQRLCVQKPHQAHGCAQIPTLQPTDREPRPSCCAGNTEEIHQEVERLSQKLEQLHKADPSIFAIQADEQADPDGQILALMLRWRGQRLHAIELEIQRLIASMILSEQADELHDEL